jgi:acetolactate synthase-1/3 small subunit
MGGITTVTEEKHTISLLVDNQPGVLARVAGMFSGRGYNIESLSVAATMDPLLSRITVVTRGDQLIIEQINKQLNKLVNVLKVHDLTKTDFVERQMALVKIRARPPQKAEILRLVDIFRSKVVDVSSTHYTVELTGTEDKLEAFLTLLKPMGIKEIARTGSIALSRNKK